jgi:hypothetical protein
MSLFFSTSLNIYRHDALAIVGYFLLMCEILYNKQVNPGFIDSRQNGESTYSFHFHFHDFKWSYSSTVNQKERDSNASSSSGKLFQNSSGVKSALHTYCVHVNELDNGSPYLFVP